VSVAVQINTIDAEHRLMTSMLPHYARVLGPHVDEILVSVNRRAGAANPEFESYLDEMAGSVPGIRWHVIDDSPAAIAAVSTRYFGGRPYALDDWKGTPIHAGLQPQLLLESPYVLHLDSDILLGGDVGAWLKAAVVELTHNPDIVFVNPLAGPPATTPNRYQPTARAVTLSDGSPGWAFDTVSTRIYLAEHDRLAKRILPLATRPPSAWSERVRARLLGRRKPSALLEPIMGDAMAARGCWRLDMAGPGDAWSLHLPRKPPALLDQLDRVVAAVESGDIPDRQRGDYDLNDSFVPLPPVPSRAKRAVTNLTTIVSYQARRVGASRRPTS
jgi:hypothetical protein